ncbi:MAG: 6-phosphogluconolactonase [Trueperaceae bacterium]|nr:6-phosphogluconolactonase [Trueperaceae bacterium]
MHDIVVLKDNQELAAEAARQFVALAKAAIDTTGKFTVALSGGSTPQKLHTLLANQYKHSLDWSKVFVFFGDERFVAPFEPESNYLMADETLLSLVDIPEENIFPFATIDLSPEEAAELYEKELKKFFGERPSFDLILLGIGPDGHTASLFPGHPEVLNPSDAFVRAVYDSPKAPPIRLTLTYALINQAKQVIFLVGGQGKTEALKNILEGPADLPAAKVRPENGEVLWLLDREAAKGLSLPAEGV